MMKNIFYIFCFLIILSTACGPIVRTEKVEDANFAAYETFAFLPSGDSSEARTILEKKAIKEVTQEMEARGYELNATDPDLLVLVKTMFEEEETLVAADPYLTTYNYYGPGFYEPTVLDPFYYPGYAGIGTVTPYGTAIEEVEYVEGTFLVDVIDASNNQIIWRGWSETPVDRANLDESIRDYMDNIYEEYPVEPVNE